MAKARLEELRISNRNRVLGFEFEVKTKKITFKDLVILEMRKK